MTVRILHGDCREVLKTLPEASVHCVVTSPPYYGLRDYGVAGQIGLEQTPAEYVEQLVSVFREVRRVLREDGVVFLNLGDSYAMSTKGAGGQGKQNSNAGSVMGDRHWQIPSGIKPKDLIGIPWRVAFALQADGWWLRSAIIWHKPNPMPESVLDRPTSAYETVFLLAKSERYFYDADAIAEQAIYPSDNRACRHDLRKEVDPMCVDRGSRARTGKPTGDTRNARNVWTIATQPYHDAHFATMPPNLVEPCILAGSPKGGTVLDPFGGAGTTALVADRFCRDAIIIELNADYVRMAERRLRGDAPLFAEVQTA